MGLVQKSFSDIITFSRSSNATRVGPTGLVEYAPHNLILQSQTLDNASWTKTDASITANAVAAPDGTVTADKLVENSSNAAHYVGSTAPSVTDTVPYTISVYAKAAERSVLQIVPSAAGFPVAFANFDLATGVIGSFSGITSYAITSVGNGWYRCSVTLSANATTTSGFVLVVQNSTTAARAGSYTGDGTSGIYLWGAQLAVGPYALDYTPTTSAAVYGPRFDYDPVTLAARGLLVEEQRTNLLTYSDDFSNAAWDKGSGFTLTPNAIASPDGTINADLFVRGSTLSFAWLSQTVVGNASQPITFSCWVRTVSGASSIALVISDVSLASAGSSYLSIDATWKRLSFSIAAGQLSNTTYIGVGFLMDAGQSAYFWGAQLEAGSFATSYIPTIASTVTRSADVASVNTLSPWYSSTEGTLFAECVISANVASSRVIASLSDGGTNNENLLYSYETIIQSLIQVSGVTQASLLTANSFTVGNVLKSASGYKANDFGLVLNAGTVATDTSGTIPSVNVLKIGVRGDGTLQQTFHLRRLAYYPRKLSSAELQTLTA